MKSQRSRPLRRLVALSVVPVLLALPLFILIRVSRPATAADDWLWEGGEKTHPLDVYFGSAYGTNKLFKCAAKRNDLHVADRQGIRAFFRSFEGSSPFVPSPVSYQAIRRMTVVDMNAMYFRETIRLVKMPDGYYVFEGGSLFGTGGMVSKVNLPSVRRFLRALRSAVTKAQHQQAGYSLQTLPSWYIP